MTDEVAELVLADNYDQNLALANAVAIAPALLHVHEDWMRTLERAGVLNRELEALPTRREVAAPDRAQGGADRARSSSVLMSCTKIVLAEDLLDSDLPDDPFFRSELFSYFPAKMRQGYRGQMEEHQLRREIVVTQIVNQLVNNAGITYFHRLAGETSATAAELDPGQLRGPGDLRRRPAAASRSRPSTTRSTPRCRPTCGWRSAPWSSGPRAGCSTAAGIADDTESVVDAFEVVVEKVMAELPVADGRPRARGLRGAARRAGRARACPRTWPSGWRCARRRT